jgi:uncharacterized Zn finger protein
MSAAPADKAGPDVPPRRWAPFRPYVSAADKRTRAAEAASELARRRGQALDPIAISGRAIVNSFWAQAWCQNLESYADFAHRLARGRSYARSGAVVDLQIAAGRIAAQVSGTRLYTVEIEIAALAAARWKSLARACTGRIGSLVGLLRGELPDEVMRVVTDRGSGLFPEPLQPQIRCSCPDWATVCKHVAATLYGVGVRLDTRPELLFVLRGVDPQDLVEQASAGLAAPTTAAVATLDPTAVNLAELFGIELLTTPTPARAPRQQTGKKAGKQGARKDGTSGRRTTQHPKKNPAKRGARRRR